MANSFVTGLLTGFMKTTAEDISKRKDQAEQYFNDRMEEARIRGQKLGLQNKSAVTSSVAMGQKLMGAGVPKDIVMSIASQNPDDMETFYDHITELQAEGVNVDENFIRNLVKVKGEVNTDESLSSFFSRIYGDLKNNMKAEPAAFKADPKGSIWATMMGYNAMDRAQARLETTPVYGDYTASEILAMDGIPQNVENTTADFNYALAGESVRDIRQQRRLEGKSDVPSVAETKSVQDAFDDAYEIKFRELIAEGVPPEKADVEAKTFAGQTVASTEAFRGVVPYMDEERKRYILGDPTEEDTTTVSSPETPAISTPSPTVSQPEVAPQVNEDPMPDPQPGDRLPSGHEFVTKNADGTTEWMLGSSTLVLTEDQIRNIFRGQSLVEGN